MNVAHVATIAAYPIKDELGGGYRGVYKAVGEPRIASPRFDTLDQARHWAKLEAWNRHHDEPRYSLAALRRHGEYQASVWIAV